MSITSDELVQMSFTNSDKLPGKVVITDKKGNKHYWEWVGIGWIPTDPCEEAVEVIDE